MTIELRTLRWDRRRQYPRACHCTPTRDVRQLTNYYHSVYVQNLEERVKLEPLVDSLRTIFSEFGNVVDIVAKKNFKAKGQAFVVFDDAQSAHNAVEEMQGFELFEKPMSVSMARTQSDKTVEIHCSGEEVATHKRHRLAEKGTPGPDAICSRTWSANASQTKRRPWKLRKTRGSSSAGLERLWRPDQARRPDPRGSNRPAWQPQLLFLTNTYLQTRFSSCKMSQTSTMSMLLLRYLVASMGSARFDWSQGGAVLHSWNTMPSKALSRQKRIRQE